MPFTSFGVAPAELALNVSGMGGRGPLVLSALVSSQLSPTLVRQCVQIGLIEDFLSLGSLVFVSGAFRNCWVPCGSALPCAI